MNDQTRLDQSARIAGQWFQAAEDSGDFMGIRYGLGTVGSEVVDWSFVPHAECDGIGGFARLLRKHGVSLQKLPVSNHARLDTIRSLWNLYRASLQDGDCAPRSDWALYEKNRPGPSKAVSWHLFSETDTERIRQQCRQQSVSVNSYLMKQLDQSIRPDIHNPNGILRWVIPVNLRGDVTHKDDTANHVSYVNVCVGVNDTVETVQRQVRKRLTRSEHWGTYLTMIWIGKILDARAKFKLILKDRMKPKGNIGAFSNLGVWEAGKTQNTNDFWLFCPPVGKGQLLGAGCVTYQNRLSLTVQAHPGLSDRPELAENWIKRWVRGSLDGFCSQTA